MKLADWMFENGWTPADLRRALRVKSRSTVLRYISGEREPCDEVMNKIEELTGGKVTRKDFRDPSPPKCAVLVTMPDGSMRYVLPFSRSKAEWAAVERVLKDDGTGDPPICWQQERAEAILKGRSQRLRPGLFRLDGHLVDLRRLIAEANRLRMQWGLEPIRYPGVDGSRVIDER